jgi:hypothetical protein
MTTWYRATYPNTPYQGDRPPSDGEVWVTVTSDGLKIYRAHGSDSGQADAGSTDAGTTTSGQADAGPTDGGTSIDVTLPSSMCSQIVEMWGVQQLSMTFARPPEGMAEDDPRWAQYKQDLEQFGKDQLDPAAMQQLSQDVEQLAAFCLDAAQKQQTQSNDNQPTDNSGSNGSPAVDAGDEGGGFGGGE